MKTLKELFELTKGPQKLRPVLVGPTGTGKTARVKKIAEELRLPVKTMLLAHMLPEEISGIPHVTAKQTSWPSPGWAVKLAKKPHILFLDEFDKARPDVWGAVLTLLWDLKVGDIDLHPETILVAAMQPVSPGRFLSTETGKAISARSVFIPIEDDWGRLEKSFDIDLSWLPKRKVGELPILPEPSPRQIEQVLNLLETTSNEKVKLLIVKGTLPGQLADNLLDALTNRMPTKPEDIMLAISKGEIRLRPGDSPLSVAEVVSLADVAPLYSTPHGIGELVFFLWSNKSGATQDDRAQFLERFYKALEAQGDEAVLCPSKIEKIEKGLVKNPEDTDMDVIDDDSNAEAVSWAFINAATAAEKMNSGEKVELPETWEEKEWALKYLK